MNWYLEVFKKYADFSGRARRTEYWMFVLFNVLITLSIIIIGSALGLEEYMGIPLLLYLIAIIIPSIAVSVRRLHDQDKSGAYIFVRLIPFIGGIWYLVLMCTDGSYGKNKYGLNPKNPVDNEINDIGIQEA